MNCHAYDLLEQPAALVLRFDPKSDRIGMRLASRLMPNAVPIKIKGLANNRMIRAKPFMTRYDIRLDGTVRFRSAIVEKGMLILEPRKMTTVGRGSKISCRTR